MSSIKIDQDTLFQSTSMSDSLYDSYLNQQCICSNTLTEVKHKITQIVSTLKQQKDEFIQASNRQILTLKDQRRKTIEQKDQVIEQLKNEIYKLISVKNQMQKEFDSTLRKRDQQIILLKGYIQQNIQNIQPPKVLTSKYKTPSSLIKRSELRLNQIFSLKQSLMEKDIQLMYTPTTTSLNSIASMTSISRKSSVPKYTPLKKIVSDKYLTRSQNVKAALKLISKVNNHQWRDAAY